jgi:hypothetical protein
VYEKKRKSVVNLESLWLFGCNSIHEQVPFTMNYPTRPTASHIRSGSLQQGSTQTSVLQTRVEEKRAELASLRELQTLSARVVDQMQMLEDKLSTLADGSEGELNSVVKRIADS